MAYRLGGLAWVINGSIGSLLMMYIWTIVTPDTGLVVTYYLGIILLGRVTGSWSFGQISESIKDGSISQNLVKPFHYVYHQEFSHDIGAKVNRLVSMIPYIIVLGILFNNYLHLPSLDKVFIAIPAMFMGYIINFLLGSSLGLLTVWTGDADGIGRTYDVINGLAAGYVIPYFFLPLTIRNIFTILPFRYVVSFPVEIMLNNLSSSQLMSGYLILSFWTIASIVLFRWLDAKSARSFSAHGG